MAASAARTAVAARVALVVLAVLTAGWFALSLRNQHLERDAVRLLRAQPPQAQAALEKLEHAGTLNAGRTSEQIAITARWFLGEHERADREMRALLRKEPENRGLWLLLANLLRPDDPAGADAALRRAAALNGHLPAGG